MRTLTANYLAEICESGRKAVTSAALSLFLSSAEKAVRFRLPDNCRLIEDAEFRGLDRGQVLHLPYPVTALEFDAVNDTDGRRVHVVTLAIQTGDVITVMTAAQARAGVLPSLSRVILVRTLVTQPDSGCGVEVMIADHNMREVSATAAAGMSEVERLSVVDTLHFLNALACSNVVTEKHTPSAKDIKRGRASMKDEYHTLMITVPRSGVVGGGDGGTHASPREHLRRGHIKTVHCGVGRTETRKVWVNATVVNPGVGGKIIKDYEVRSAA